MGQHHHQQPRTILSHIFLLTAGLNFVQTFNAFTNPLEGRRASCQFEGEPVAVDHIDTLKCYSCKCKNGFVECKNDYYCPPTDGCHMLVEKTADGCCRQCKGCNYGGVHYASHTEWTDKSDPCRVLRCEAGVITESNLKCYTPCSNPTPARSGQCCSTCPECKINGQIATADRDVIVTDDPCVQCRCIDDQLICTKRACPVLQCAPGKRQQSAGPGECCPHCTGTRTLLTVPKTCTLQSAFFRDGQAFSIDRCTSCQCCNETSICQRTACPILDCAPELQVPTSGLPNDCCKQCLSGEPASKATTTFFNGHLGNKIISNSSVVGGGQCLYGGRFYEVEWPNLADECLQILHLSQWSAELCDYPM